MIKVFLVTLIIGMSGEVKEELRKEMSSLVECKHLMRQNEFTKPASSSTLMVVYYCHVEVR